jgi:hypothetical protein
MTITCTCGHEAAADRFWTTLTGPLPAGHFQCPACKKAWRVVKTPITVSKFTGRWITAPNKIESTQAYL